MLKALIFAGNACEAKWFQQDLKLNAREWRYIESADRIRGLRGINHIKIGTWYKRADRHEIEGVLLAAESEEAACPSSE